jgi:hypothetical protein
MGINIGKATPAELEALVKASLPVVAFRPR